MAPAKSFLITGCSDGGIGSALAQSFQAQGLRLFATAHTISKMTALTDIPSITLLPLDLTSSTSSYTTVEAVKLNTNGKLDYLANNAAIN
jgi:1-acylglycerone phosphate reductase